MQSVLQRTFTAFSGLYLACLMGANAVVLVPQDALGTSGVFAASWIILHLTCFAYILAIRLKDGLSLMALGASLCAIVISCVISPKPYYSMTYGVMLFGNFVFAYLVFCYFDLTNFLRIWGKVILGMVIISFAGMAAGYDNVFYFDPHERSNIFGFTPVRGFFSHKIRASLYAAIAIVIFLTLFRSWFRVVAVAVLSIFILLTGSATGITVLVFSLALLALFAIIKRFRIPLWQVAAIVLIPVGPATYFLYNNFEALLVALGRDPTLTGRTYLWSWGLDAWLERPILGWGFRGYFESEHAARQVAFIPSFHNYDVPHFHQSFLQTAVDFGAIGLFVVLAAIARSLTRSYRRGFLQGDPAYACSFLLLGSILFASLTMFLFVDYNHACTVFIAACFFYCLSDRGVGQPQIRRLAN